MNCSTYNKWILYPLYLEYLKIHTMEIIKKKVIPSTKEGKHSLTHNSEILTEILTKILIEICTETDSKVCAKIRTENKSKIYYESKTKMPSNSKTEANSETKTKK